MLPLESNPQVSNQLIEFTKDENKALFQQYLALKFDLFVEEMGWTVLPHSLSQKTCFEDNFDADSTFFSVINCQSEMLGIIRGAIADKTEDLYRKELYLDFLNASCLKSVSGKIATINSLAVKKEFRRSQLSIPAQKSEYSYISDTLIKQMVNRLYQSGAALIVLSAIEGGAYSVMRRAGFQTINPPHLFYGKDYSSTDQKKTLKIFDMALAVGQNPDIQAYINQREALTLGY